MRSMVHKSLCMAALLQLLAVAANAATCYTAYPGIEFGSFANSNCAAIADSGVVCTAQCDAASEVPVTAACITGPDGIPTWKVDNACAPVLAAAQAVELPLQAVAEPQAVELQASVMLEPIQVETTTTTIAAETVGELTCAGRPTSVPSNAVALPNTWPVSCANGAEGTSCVAVCKEGFAQGNLVSPPTSVCTVTSGVAAWGPVTGGCTKVCIGTPPTVTNGALTNCLPTGSLGGTAHGRSCVGTCSANFAGAPTVTCTLGVWGPVVGSCVQVDQAVGVCPGLPLTSPATPTDTLPWSCRDYLGGTNCVATCKAGFASGVATTPPTVGCISDSGVEINYARWSTTVTGKCTKVCTGTLPTLANGVWASTCTPTASANGVIYSSSCSGTCSPTYAGAPILRCNSNGAWEALGSCPAVGATGVCPGLPTVATATNAQPWSCRDILGGSTCVATCNTGYSAPAGFTAPTVACITDVNVGTFGARWNTTVTGRCSKTV